MKTWLLISVLFSLNPQFSASDIQAPRLSPRDGPLRDLPVERVIHLDEYGVVPGTGGDMLLPFREALEQLAFDEIPTRLVLAPGEYRFSEFDEDLFTYAVVLDGVQDLVLDGPGALIVMTSPLHGFLEIKNSRRVIVRGLTLEWDPLPFTQGTIAEVNPDEGWYELAVEDGFPSLDDPFFHLAPLTWGSHKDPSLPIRNKTLGHGVIHVRGWEAQGEGRYRLFPSSSGVRLQEELSAVEPGDKYVHLIRRTMAQGLRAVQSEDVSYIDVTFYSCPGAPFIANSCARVSVLNCRTLLKEGRYQSVNADAIHFNRNRSGPWIEGCLFEGVPDDPLNIYTVRSVILEQRDSHTLLLKKMLPPTFRGEEEIGESLLFVNPRQGLLIAESPVEAVSILPEGVLVRVGDPLPELQVGDTWDADQAHLTSNLSGGFVLKDNVFRNNWRHVILMTHDGLIEGNLFEQQHGPGLTISNHNRSRPQAEHFAGGDLIIRSNRFVRCDFGRLPYSDWDLYGAIALNFKTHDFQVAEDRFIRRVIIEDNEIEDWRRAGIQLRSAEDVLIQNNRFVSSADVPLDPDTPHAVVSVDNVKRVLIRDNEIIDPRGIRLLHIGENGAEELQEKNNPIRR